MFCSFTLVSCCKQDACFGKCVFCAGFLLFTLSFRFVLWSNYNVVDPSSSFLSQPLNSNCFKVNIGLMVKSLSGFLPLRQLSSGGSLYLCSDWVFWYTIQSVFNNFTMLKGIFNVCFKKQKHLPLGALENLPGLCGWILDWGTLQLSVCVGVQRWGSHS